MVSENACWLVAIRRAQALQGSVSVYFVDTCCKMELDWPLMTMDALERIRNNQQQAILDKKRPRQ